ncbi:MAG: polysaccharide biosynthesis protein, partial [Anaerovoracaceae bacterium]
VPLMEDNPRESVMNNVLGTKNVMDASEEYLVDKFIMVSTDKAVNPTNVMGATKRIGEMLIQERSRSSETCFAAVRFGNVLGSNGSVIPTFRKQIAVGGPVTVTHREICRYFMTIPEAVQLVIQAGAMAGGGEIFVLDMGEPVKIMGLAEKLIRLSGFEPYEDIKIEITGLRPGEKLYEELLLSEEGLRDTAHHKIFVGEPAPAGTELLDLLGEPGKLESAVREICEMPDRQIRAWLRKMVPNYKPAPNGHYEL